jgi:methylated-DNA-protein-cysteine methyltransferase-like protein
MSTVYERIYAVIRRIPLGRVATYGQVAALAGIPLRARQVGYALHSLPSGKPVPWHRVINAQGRISARAGTDGDIIQLAVLKREGIRFDTTGRVNLSVFQWRPALPKKRGRKSRTV